MRRWKVQSPIIRLWAPNTVILECWRVKRDGSTERVTIEIETEVYHHTCVAQKLHEVVATYARWWRTLNDRMKESK